MTAAKTPALSERQWQAQVLRLAGLHGWMAHHTHDSRRSQPGFPDLVLVRAGRLIFAELKTDTGRLRPEQAVWLDELQRTPAEVYVWRPADVDAVVAVLSRRGDA